MEEGRTSRKAIALLSVVFLLGLALGALGEHVFGERVWGSRLEEKGRRPRLVEELTRELTLTADQQRQLDAILSETRKGYQTIYEQVRPQFEEIRQQGRARIRTILTPEQLPKFEEFMRRHDEVHRKKSER